MSVRLQLSMTHPHGGVSRSYVGVRLCEVILEFTAFMWVFASFGGRWPPTSGTVGVCQVLFWLVEGCSCVLGHAFVHGLNIRKVYL